MTTPARHDVHQWAGASPDHCIACDVDWSDADLTCRPAPASAEPTTEDMAVALSLTMRHSTHGAEARYDFADAIARALNSQRAEIVARYEQKWLAAVCEAYIVGNGNGSNGLYDPEQIEPIIARIREAAPK